MPGKHYVCWLQLCRTTCDYEVLDLVVHWFVLSFTAYCFFSSCPLHTSDVMTYPVNITLQASFRKAKLLNAVGPALWKYQRQADISCQRSILLKRGNCIELELQIHPISISLFPLCSYTLSHFIVSLLNQYLGSKSHWSIKKKDG